MQHRLTTTLAMAGILALGATACGSDDGEADATAPTITPAEPTTTATTATTPTEVDGGGYGPATVDLDITDERTTAIAEPVVDGVYFSQSYVSDGTTATFTLTQYFQCDSSTNVPDEPTVVCASGFGTLDEPSTSVDLAPESIVSIATGDLENPTRADVTASEFARLVAGEVPGADAPAGFEFTNHFVFVAVENGSVVAAEQFYTS